MPREQGEIPISIRRAVTRHCRECNDNEGAWTEANDCLVWRCWLYPFRPGKGGEDRVQVKRTTIPPTPGQEKARSAFAARARGASAGRSGTGEGGGQGS